MYLTITFNYYIATVPEYDVIVFLKMVDYGMQFKFDQTYSRSKVNVL